MSAQMTTATTTPSTTAPTAAPMQMAVAPPVPMSPVRGRSDGDDGRGHVARRRVGGVEAEHCDEVRPDYVQILRDMEIEDPSAATDDQRIQAGITRALDGLKRYGVGTLIPRSQATGKRISARWDHVYKWDPTMETWIVKSRYLAAGVAR